MKNRTLIALVLIASLYKLATHWLDSRERGHGSAVDTEAYIESSPHEIRDDGERRIPDVRLGFQRER